MNQRKPGTLMEATALLSASMYRMRAAIADALASSWWPRLRRKGKAFAAASRQRAAEMEWRASELSGCITAVRGTSQWIAFRSETPLPPVVTVKDVILWPGQLDIAYGSTPEEAIDRLRLECFATREEA